MRWNSSEILKCIRSTGTPCCRRAYTPRRPLGYSPPLGTFSPRTSLAVPLSSAQSLVASFGDSLSALSLVLNQRAWISSGGAFLMFWPFTRTTTFSGVLWVSSSLFYQYLRLTSFQINILSTKNFLKLLKSLHDHELNLRRFVTTVENKILTPS